MEIVALPELAGDPEPIYVEIAKHQPEYLTLPALVYQDGKILTEWRFTEEERSAIARGENLRLWIWSSGAPIKVDERRHFNPIALEITSEGKS